MKRAWIIAIALFLGWLLALNNAARSADAGSAPDCVIKIGDYRTLTLLREFKIGAAQYVNPSLFNTTVVVNRFEYEKVINDVKAEALIGSIEDGQLAFARVSDGKYQALSSDSKEWTELLAKLKAGQLSSPDSKGIIFLSMREQLGNIKANGKLVSWSATKPVVANGAANCGQ
ncbi:MAG TPA: hypothetical protein VMU06_16640 [Stellaceae bacterium]|nr:hypothetical protein [Stellaceae bacterium]